MPVRLHHIVVDAHDLPGLARFWSQALGWTVLSERPREVVIGPDENAPVGVCFMPATDEKTVKNRVHLDVRVAGREVEGEERKRLVSEKVEQLVEAGASIAWVNQDVRGHSIVLRDPEGNEFCVIRPKETLTR